LSRKSLLLSELGPAREQLVAAREQELWAQTFPNEDARTMPQFGQLGGGDPNISKRAGLSTVTAIDRLHKALKEDADWLTGAVTPKQREIIDAEPQAKPARRPGPVPPTTLSGSARRSAKRSRLTGASGGTTPRRDGHHATTHVLERCRSYAAAIPVSLPDVDSSANA
jgi:hypothetical protein